jgi:hypothetical protein
MLPGSPEAAATAVKDQVEAEFLAALSSPNPHLSEMNLPAALTEDGS